MDPYLAQYDTQYLMSILKIHNDEPANIQENQDLYVGKNKHLTLTIRNGQTIQFKNIIVLGQLTIQTSNMTETAIKAKCFITDLSEPVKRGYHYVNDMDTIDPDSSGNLLTHDFFQPGKVEIKGRIHAKVHNLYVPETIEKFQQQLIDIILSDFRSQKEIVNKTGFKSILI